MLYTPRLFLLPRILLMVWVSGWLAGVQAQDDPDADQDTPVAVEVNEVVSDGEIVDRLTNILAATGWFQEIAVQVDAGVVFLDGIAGQQDQRQWAERLASNTEGVVAVVNRMTLAEGPAMNFAPARQQFGELKGALIRNSPMLVLALLLLVLTWLLTRWAVRISRAILGRRVSNHLLRDVAARAIAVPVFLLGLYFVLSISGLTGLAVTVIGSTGLLGLIIGFAFRDIAENFLASILISMNRPFATGDLIEVAGHQGFVQSVNTRSTLLMTLQGNHVQIPNATIYKSTIINLTANPKARFDFSVGIGYDDRIEEAQGIALGILREHPAVLEDPESLILVESLGAATVNLRIYFWVNVHQYSFLKVRSAVIRQLKTAFEEAGISMPDEAREVVFPKGVPVQMLADGKPGASEKAKPGTALPGGSPDKAESREDKVRAGTSPDIGTAPTEGEGDYLSEAPEINRQARESRSPEGGDNLLEPREPSDE